MARIRAFRTSCTLLLAICSIQCLIRDHSTAPAHAAAPVPTAAENSARPAAAPVPPTSGHNGNVYGAEPASAGDTAKTADPKQTGYNRGYSYNTGIKPYRTGYTYFQPFGDAAAEQEERDRKNNEKKAEPKTAPVPVAPAPSPPASSHSQAPQTTQEQMPADMAAFLGADPKSMGPVKVIRNQDIPLDENGIPNLDAIQIPQNNQNDPNGQARSQAPVPQQQPPPPPVPVQLPVNPNDFAMNDFNFDNIMGMPTTTTPPPPSLFDFNAPNANSFDFAPSTINGGDPREYNGLDQFGGNLNNFDSYLGDESRSSRAAPSSGGGLGTGLSQLGQQMPSEIVSLGNAFGGGGGNGNNPSNVQSNSGGNDFANMLSQLTGNQPSQQPQGGLANMDLDNFGSSSNNRPQQPLNSPFIPFF